MNNKTIERTLQYYDTHAEETSAAYELADINRLAAKVLPFLEPGSRLLDLGCGSGRDAAYLLKEGFDVYGLDGSAPMLREAVLLHPELSGRLIERQLPASLPYPDDHFDAVLATAVLMHFERDGIRKILIEVSRVLRPEGLCCISVRNPVGHDTNTDEHGRFYLRTGKGFWETLAGDCGFLLRASEQEPDAIGRDHLWSWYLLAENS